MMSLDFLTSLFSSATVTGAPGGGLVLHSGPWRYVIWIIAFLVLMPLSRWCWRRQIGGHFAPGVFVVSFAIPLIVLPGIATESVRVSPGGLSIRTGFWFLRTQLDYSLFDLSEVVETTEQVAQRRVPRRERFWEFRYRSARARRLDLPDLLDANRAPVIEYFRRHGVKFRPVD